MVKVEAEEKLVREVFSKYLEGKGVNHIVQYMNSFSRGKESGTWYRKYIRTILSNYTLLGRTILTF
ncbi:recombinase family protein [Bacillus sp. FJAT-27238]|uniref:recombinase family protein n=1 Tax=Bacillales TaxID=1385 RepID=UPI0009DA34A4